MASGPLLEGGGLDGSREKRRWVESKVYTRKIHNKFPKPNQNQDTPPHPTQTQPPFSQQALAATTDVINSSFQQLQPPAPLENPRPSPPHQSSAASDKDAFSFHPKTVANYNTSMEDNRVVVINLASKQKTEVRELRRKLTSELELVRLLVRKLEERQAHISTKDTFKTASPPVHTLSHLSANDLVASFPIKSIPTLSEAASATVPAPACHELTISVPAPVGGDNVIVDVMEKEKRTPKANQYYANTDFLLGKDKFPLHESNKKSKVNGIKSGLQSLETKINELAFRKCEMLLSKLMKHTHGWVFNTPVDAKALGLPDYHKIITHPMDLGTVKSRLSKNWYKAPKEFAEDVRLTFHNAMTYNPKGQDVNIMAQQLLQMFEERWPVIEADLAYLYSPPSMKRPPPFHTKRTLEMSDSTVNPLAVDIKPKSMSRLTHIGRPLTSKKPKAKDPNKREMTFEEKQRLSSNLQNLPSEKLDLVVEIIRKRNLSLSQHEDEIEVDIDSVDTETLWELDRFVTNYKKSLSKNRRRAQLANLSKVEVGQHAQKREQRLVDSSPPELLNERKTVSVEKNAVSSLPVVGIRIGENANTSSSSSSSSDSGSSSSDSDSETSSGYDSDRAKSPGT